MSTTQHRIPTQSGFYAVPEANKIFSIQLDGVDHEFNRLWIYPASAVDHNAGKLTANVGDVYIGEKTASGNVTPDKLAFGDPPILIELPQGRSRKLSEIILQADNANDGVWLKFWTA